MRWIMMIAVLISAPASAGPNKDAAFAAQDAWELCVVRAARALAGRAQAETVVTAAFGRCTNEEAEFRYRMNKWSQPFGFGGGGYNAEESERQMETQRQRIRGVATSAVLEAPITGTP